MEKGRNRVTVTRQMNKCIALLEFMHNLITSSLHISVVIKGFVQYVAERWISTEVLTENLPYLMDGILSCN